MTDSLSKKQENPATRAERLHYLDAARGFAILLVILGHIWETEQPLPVIIYSFHVPLFFIISGILAAYNERKRRTLKQFVLSGLRRLIVPYLFFEAVFILLFGLRSHFDFSSWDAHLYDGLLLSPLNVPLWFLPTLFLAELVLFLLTRLLKNRGLTALLCALIYLLPFAAAPAHVLPDALLRCMTSFGFLAAGYFGSDLIHAKNPPLALLLPLAAADAWLAWLNGKTGIYKLTFHNPVLFTVCALAGSCCTIFLLKKGLPDNLKKYRAIRSVAAVLSGLLTLAGKNSLTILGLHIIVLRVFQEILGLHTDSLAGGLIALAGICLLLAPVCAFLNRFLPFLAGKRSRRPDA